MCHTHRQTPNAKRQTPNAKRQTPNAKRQTPNAKRQTPNAKRQKHGRIIHLADAQIASIALVYELVLVTRNTKDFVMIDGLQAVNPF
ncbi:hypothetical protein [Moraxella marmotae]|uniref:hypothetical protein n=1 Tax=Moraxella marmotae TaxID=3344520 RepID=UPI0035F278FD